MIVKRTMGLYAALMALYVGMTAVGVFEGMSMVNSFAAMFSVSIPLACFSLDELARWEKFAVTLPLGRKGIVQAKYVLILLLTVGTTLLIMLMNLALFAFFPSRISSLPVGLLSVAGITAASLLIHAVMMPACFRFGVQKARVAVFVTLGATVAAITGIGMMTTFPMRATAAISGWGPMLWQITAMVLGVLVVALALLFVSYQVSLRIYEKREF